MAKSMGTAQVRPRYGRIAIWGFAAAAWFLLALYMRAHAQASYQDILVTVGTGAELAILALMFKEGPGLVANVEEIRDSERRRAMEAAYSNHPKVVARIGDAVLGPGQIRAIVIAIEGTFVTILGIGTSRETGDTFVLPQRWIHKCPASECFFLEKQTLSL